MCLFYDLGMHIQAATDLLFNVSTMSHQAIPVTMVNRWSFVSWQDKPIKISNQLLYMIEWTNVERCLG